MINEVDKLNLAGDKDAKGNPGVSLEEIEHLIYKRSDFVFVFAFVQPVDDDNVRSAQDTLR